MQLAGEDGDRYKGSKQPNRSGQLIDIHLHAYLHTDALALLIILERGEAVACDSISMLHVLSPAINVDGDLPRCCRLTGHEKGSA